MNAAQWRMAIFCMSLKWEHPIWKWRPRSTFELWTLKSKTLSFPLAIITNASLRKKFWVCAGVKTRGTYRIKCAAPWTVGKRARVNDMHFKCINWGMAIIQSSLSLLRLSSLSRRSFLRTGQLRPFIPILIWASAPSLGNRGLWRRRWWQRRLSYPTIGTQGQRSAAAAECRRQTAANNTTPA